MSAWPDVTLGEIFDVSSSKRVLQSDWKTSGVPFYRAREIVKLARDGFVDNELFISEELYVDLAQKYGAPRAGDIMVSAVGTLGACYVVQPNDRFYFKDASVLRFRAKREICPQFFSHAFRTNYVLDQVHAGSGSTVGTYTIERANSTRLRVPPLQEQRRIAAILDQAETLRTQRRQALAHLDTLTQSLFLDMFGDPARNTLGLPMQALGDLGDWHSGGTPPRGSGHYFEGDIPWFSSGELESMYVSDSSEHISESAVRETSAKLVPAGALMLGMYDTAALKSSIALNACSCNQAIAFASIRSDRALTEYVYFAVQVGREDFRRLQRGVRQKNLNLSMVREIRIPAPTLALQQTFATRIQAIEALKATHRTALAQLDALFASLQQRAFAGEL